MHTYNAYRPIYIIYMCIYIWGGEGGGMETDSEPEMSNLMDLVWT